MLPLSWIYDQFLALLTAACVLTVLLTVYLYLSSFGRSKVLSSGGNTESKIYNFFIGRELNPRIASFDLKHFCELYPGLIGWLIIDLGMLQKQYEQLHYVSMSMLLVCVFQFIYVLDALWFEKAILSTMDIVHDGFGFMLAFGDLVWVPFTYSLQARYLVDHPQVSSHHIHACVQASHVDIYFSLSSHDLGTAAFRQIMCSAVEAVVAHSCHLHIRHEFVMSMLLQHICKSWQFVHQTPLHLQNGVQETCVFQSDAGNFQCGAAWHPGLESSRLLCIQGCQLSEGYIQK